jgi:hypothetical protein
MKSKKTANEDAWEKLFEEYNIIEKINKDGIFQISADQIKEHREPRLMAKFDHSINLPEIFHQNHLSILPITRGYYVIAPINTYAKFETTHRNITHLSLPDSIESLSATNIPTETIAINCAYASGILSDFLEEPNLMPTVSGRMGSENFSFFINDTRKDGKFKIEVDSSQIEIDAAYEGGRSLNLIEAKRDIADDFLVRQLYYPYRTWNGRISKTVRPIYLVYSNGIFMLYEYVFKNPDFYNSLELVKQKNYSIEDTAIGINEIEEIVHNKRVQKEPEIPFPQADSFERVINLCELLDGNNSCLTREEVTENYAFDVRQTNYYTDAGRYLGLIDKSKNDSGDPCYFLTTEGHRIMRLPFRERQLAFCSKILKHRIFKDIFKIYLSQGSLPDRNAIIKKMAKAKLYNVGSISTMARRASTIRGWLNWIVELTQM